MVLAATMSMCLDFSSFDSGFRGFGGNHEHAAWRTETGVRFFLASVLDAGDAQRLTTRSARCCKTSRARVNIWITWNQGWLRHWAVSRNTL